MQTLQIILVIAFCILILDAVRVGWLATRPASRSRTSRSKERRHGTD
jgi:hypothetical protein